MEEIIVATNNEGKIKEIKEILTGYNLKTLKEVDCEIDVVEDGNTFEENSRKKAKEISEILNKPCLADDSGLCIDYLDGWPGVYTGRIIGKNKENLGLILEKLEGVPKYKRTARAVCYMVYYYKGEFIIGKGELKGKISFEGRGINGFGFDEVFELEDGRTLAELSAEEKNKISARYLALMDLKDKLWE
ncbi:MAG: RdgB/HAM1 family non-canonical purine NTP pyrophosphatase [Clostridia bacterium]|nr:RdgB/HAM1 family non-canonical purine NTP pyrophosphatase [Clostridia bacterium]